VLGHAGVLAAEKVELDTSFSSSVLYTAVEKLVKSIWVTLQAFKVAVKVLVVSAIGDPDAVTVTYCCL
jgi:hypothetical protein